MGRKVVIVLVFLLGVVSLPGVCTAQDILGKKVGEMPEISPPIFVLKGGTVHIGNRQILKGASVLIKDGLIQSLGENVAVPKGANEVDATGLHIYPGLIDALTDTGLKKGRRESSSSGRERSQGSRSSESQVENSEGPGLYPHISASDRIDGSASALKNWRQTGILTFHIAPDQGIFMGKTAVINLNGLTEDQMIVSSPIAMQMSFRSLGFSTYPGSLLGVIGHIKQTLLDAAHYQKSHQIYESHPRGLKRPPTNRALEALGPIIKEEMRAIFPAVREREIRRLLKLFDEFNIKGIVSGGFEADKVAELLKESNVPILLSLDFPKAPKDRHPEIEDSLSELKYRKHARRTAIGLEEAGVEYAFCSDGMKNSVDFLSGLRTVVEEGMDKESVLRAATLNAAQILGVSEQLGTLEEGKIANLLVVDGDLFDKESQIKHVFVDGIKFDVPVKAKRPKGDPTAEADLSGNWDVEVTSPMGTNNMSFMLDQVDESLTGEVESDMIGSTAIMDGSVTGDEFSFKVDVDLGMGPMTLTFSGTMTGDSLSGTVTIGEMGSAPMEGTRIPDTQ